MKLRKLLAWIPIAMFIMILYDYIAFRFKWPALGLGMLENYFMGLFCFLAGMPIVWFVFGHMFPDFNSSVVKEIKKGTKCDVLSEKERIEWGLRIICVLLLCYALMVKPT